jgi:hypothetical protein
MRWQWRHVGQRFGAVELHYCVVRAQHDDEHIGRQAAQPGHLGAERGLGAGAAHGGGDDIAELRHVGGVAQVLPQLQHAGRGDVAGGDAVADDDRERAAGGGGSLGDGAFGAAACREQQRGKG